MNNDVKTTVLGVGKAIGWWALTFAWTGLDLHSPITYVGVIKGVIDAVNGYFTNKP